MYRINNWDRCLRYFEIDYRQKKYINSLTFILVLLEVSCKPRSKEPFCLTYYRFYKLNAALRSAVVIFYRLQMNRVLLQKSVSVILNFTKYFQRDNFNWSDF